MAGLKEILDELKRRQEAVRLSEQSFRGDVVRMAVVMGEIQGSGVQTRFLEEMSGGMTEVSQRATAKMEAYGEAIALLEAEMAQARKRQ